MKVENYLYYSLAACICVHLGFEQADREQPVLRPRVRLAEVVGTLFLALAIGVHMLRCKALAPVSLGAVLASFVF